MYKFSETSLQKLQTCHNDIQTILHEVIKVYDIKVIEGARTQETQMQYFKEGKSKLDGVNQKSKHQSTPSMAVDIMPVKQDTNAFSGKELDNRRFYFMMGIVKAISEKLYAERKISHKVRFGLDWNGNDRFDDQTFHDLPHFELV